MNDLLTNLLKLQALDFDQSGPAKSESEKTALRSLIPAPILGHYDRLVARGKKGVAVVRNQVCTGCHMRLPIGTINTLLQAMDIQLCDTCGRYLYLDPAAEAQPEAAAPAPAPTPKPARKPRKKKAPVADAA